jgi:FADH2 O2-dependent halogenase
MWVIPFNNDKSSADRLCSVGINFDCDAHPCAPRDPQEEFDEFLRQHPTVAAQFKNARPVRAWTRRIASTESGRVPLVYCTLTPTSGCGCAVALE